MNYPAKIKIESLTYPVHIGSDLWHEIEELLHPFLESGGVYILTDNNTFKSCFPVLKGEIPQLADHAVFSIPPGEQSKDLSGLASVWTWLMETGAGRDSLLINLGGGVVSDLGGFAAATFNRGMTFFNIPTSLIGQVDAAIGSKSALNVAGIKNQVGLFYDPAAVYIMPVFLETLPEPHYKSGIAEIIKCAALSGYKSWQLLKQEGALDHNKIFRLIAETVSFKCRIVAEDPFDKSGRRMLNYGHTVGHALESVCNTPGGNEMLHGQAIACGMICEAYLSNKLAGMSNNDLDEISSVIKSFFELTPIGKNLFDDLVGCVNYDKKKTKNGIGFSLLESFGKHSPDIIVNKLSLIQSFDYYNGVIKQ